MSDDDAVDYLRLHDETGDFAFVERIGGRLGKRWHERIEPPEDDAGADSNLTDDDIGLLDPNDIELELDEGAPLDPARVRDKIEIARLKAELNASRNGAHSGLGELLEGVKMVEELRKEAAPQRSFVEQYRDAKELVELVNSPRREANPTQQAALSDEAVILNAFVNNDAVASKITSVIRSAVSGKADRDEVSYADVIMEAVKNGQAAQMVNAAGNVLLAIVNNILNTWTQRQPQAPTLANPDPRAQIAPQAPTAQPPQAPPQVTPTSAQQSQQFLSEINQQPQAAQPEQGAQDPVGYHLDIIVNHVISECAKATAPDAVLGDVLDYLDEDVERLHYRAVLERIDTFSTLPTETVIEFLAQSPQGQQIAALPHVVEWTSKLQELIRQNKAQDEANAPASAGH